MERAPRWRFYGWPLVAVGFVVYGLGIAPGYYSWGFFAPELIADLGLSREQIGSIFGAFTLTFALASPLAAVAISKVGLRATMTVGALASAAGFFLVSRSSSPVELYLSYALLGGIGIGFSTLLPAQTLAVYWFRRYRARATAVILLGAGVVGALVTPIDAWVLGWGDWRTGWMWIGACSVLVATISLTFVRNRPEDIGQLPDGEAAITLETQASVSPRPAWTVGRAIRTPQFFIATFAGMANTVPWRVLTAHGRLHFEDLGFAPTVAAAILGVRVGTSSFGRISGSLSDFVAPNRILAMALLTTAAGLGGLVVATTPAMAYGCVVLLGVGYGAAFTSEPVVFAHFFGREAFVGTSGLRIVVTGIVGFVGPTWAGASADATGSYGGALVALMAICIVGALVVFPCRSPRKATD